MKGKNIIVAVFSACLLAVGMMIPSSSQAQSSYSKMVTLAGYKLSPTVPTSATGTITLTIENDTLIVKGSFSGLVAPFHSGGIYYAKKNRAFNQIFTLDTMINEDKTGGKIRAADNRFPLSEGQLKLLKNGELSIRIMSTEHLQGEIGGQIPPGSS